MMEPMKAALMVILEAIVLRMEHFSTLEVLAYGGVRQKVMPGAVLTTTLHRVTV